MVVVAAIVVDVVDAAILVAFARLTFQDDGGGGDGDSDDDDIIITICLENCCNSSFIFIRLPLGAVRNDPTKGKKYFRSDMGFTGGGPRWKPSWCPCSVVVVVVGILYPDS